MVPDRHGPTAWKRWIFGLTDHLNLENIENRRWYHNSGKPRIAGLCGREGVASDHLPLSSTFFGRPKPPDLTRKTAALVPLPMLFSFWRYPRKTASPTFAHTGRTRPVTSSASPVLSSPPKPHTAPHRRQRVALSLMALTLDPRRFTPFSEGLLLFFTAAQFLMVLPLEILTQNVTQNIESRRGADRNDLRVLGISGPKRLGKHWGAAV